jgi:hypothetical protein
MVPGKRSVAPGRYIFEGGEACTVADRLDLGYGFVRVDLIGRMHMRLAEINSADRAVRHSFCEKRGACVRRAGDHRKDKCGLHHGTHNGKQT